MKQKKYEYQNAKVEPKLIWNSSKLKTYYKSEALGAILESWVKNGKETLKAFGIGK